MGLFSKKTEALHAELKERAEAATSSYSAVVHFLQYIYCGLWLRIIRRSDQCVQFICFPSMIFFNNINHGYRAAIMKKSSFWLLLSYMTAATYCYYDNVRRTMCTTIASYLLQKFVQCNFYLKNFILKIKVNLIQFSKILSF